MPPPNILLITCDEMRADCMGVAGHPVVKTPHLDRLASEGTWWPSCYVTQPTCTPSRASFLSGCYPSVMRSRMVGCWTPDDPRFLAHSFHHAGYQTASIGKLHLVPQRDEPDWLAKCLEASGHYHGFRSVDLVNGHGDNCFGPGYTPWLEARCPDWNERRQNRRRLSENVKSCYEWPFPPEVHSGNYLVERASQFLQQAGEQPFFLTVSFADPHYPFTVPEPYASFYNAEDMPPPIPGPAQSIRPCEIERLVAGRVSGDPESKQKSIIGFHSDCQNFTLRDWQTIRATYYGMITQLDSQVGKLLDALDTSGLAANTVVIFLSDHGDYLGDHGIYGKGLSYESAIRIPFIMRGPGISSGHTVEGPGTLLDLAPTLLDWAGIEEPEGLTGVSQRAALEGQKTGIRECVMVENDDDSPPMRMRTLVTGEWKLTLFADRTSGQLYHLREDPDELNNLWEAPDYIDIQRSLERRLLDEVILAGEFRNGRKQKPAPPVPKLTPARRIPRSSL